MLIITKSKLSNYTSSIWIQGLNTYTEEKQLNQPVSATAIFSEFYKTHNKRLDLLKGGML
jgi:hypothetical protein